MGFSDHWSSSTILNVVAFRRVQEKQVEGVFSEVPGRVEEVFSLLGLEEGHMMGSWVMSSSLRSVFRAELARYRMEYWGATCAPMWSLNSRISPRYQGSNDQAAIGQSWGVRASGGVRVPL